MLHGENHLQTTTSRCNKNGKCVYGFPKAIRDTTGTDDLGRVQYRRRHVKDSMVVPYSPALLKVLECHCNVDAVIRSAAVFIYLYKYLFKGVDRANFQVLQHTTAPREANVIRYERI